MLTAGCSYREHPHQVACAGHTLFRESTRRATTSEKTVAICRCLCHLDRGNWARLASAASSDLLTFGNHVLTPASPALADKRALWESISLTSPLRCVASPVPSLHACNIKAAESLPVPEHLVRSQEPRLPHPARSIDTPGHARQVP